MLSNNKNATKKLFLDFGLFWPFFNQKKAKKKGKKNWQNPNRLMKFSVIWYVDASQQRKCYKKHFFDFGHFWPFFNQKTAKKKFEKFAKIRTV